MDKSNVFIRCLTYPEYIQKTLQSLSKRGAAENAQNKNRQEKSRRKLEKQLKIPDLSEDTRLELIRQLKESPPVVIELELEEVSPSPIVQTQGGGADVIIKNDDIKADVVDKNDDINNSTKNPSNPIDESSVQQPEAPQQAAVEQVSSELPKASEPLRRSSRRKKEINYKKISKDYKSMNVNYEIYRKIYGHTKLQNDNIRNRSLRKKRKLNDLKKVWSIMQTSISEAIKESPEDIDKVYKAVNDIILDV